MRISSTSKAAFPLLSLYYTQEPGQTTRQDQLIAAKHRNLTKIQIRAEKTGTNTPEAYPIDLLLRLAITCCVR